MIDSASDTACPPFIFPNQYRGEQVAYIKGEPHRLRLSLQALAQLEAAYDHTDILQLLQRFAQDGLHTRDAMRIVQAALIGAGVHTAPALAVHDIAGGAAAARILATQLLERAFA